MRVKAASKARPSPISGYQALYEGVSDEKAIGEASHCYLYEPTAVERIKYYLPDAKLIAILRNPIDRAYSHFLHAVRSGAEPLTDFAKALREDNNGVRQKGNVQDYIGRGFYYGQLKRYFDAFGRDQVKVYLYDDLLNVPIDTLQDAFRFLGVDESFVPDVSLRRNVSGHPRYKTLDKFLRRPSSVKRALKRYLPARLRWRLSEAFDELKTRNLVQPPSVPLEVRQQLIEVYQNDILQLQKVLCWELSRWITCD